MDEHHGNVCVMFSGCLCIGLFVHESQKFGNMIFRELLGGISPQIYNFGAVGDRDELMSNDLFYPRFFLHDRGIAALTTVIITMLLANLDVTSTGMVCTSQRKKS